MLLYTNSINQKAQLFQDQFINQITDFQLPTSGSINLFKLNVFVITQVSSNLIKVISPKWLIQKLVSFYTEVLLDTQFGRNSLKEVLKKLFKKVKWQKRLLILKEKESTMLHLDKKIGFKLSTAMVKWQWFHLISLIYSFKVLVQTIGLLKKFRRWRMRKQQNNLKLKKLLELKKHKPKEKKKSVMLLQKQSGLEYNKRIKPLQKQNGIKLIKQLRKPIRKLENLKRSKEL